MGVIVSPPGSGKTIMALSIIARKRQPALILVHRRQLFHQWIERIQSFLHIPPFQIGKIEGGQCDIGENITVAMIQSLQSEKLPEKIYKSFGIILVDECHHIPAKTFREVIGRFHSYYLYGFTATPVRKNGDQKLIFFHIGDIIHEAIIPVSQQKDKRLSVVIQNTELFLPFDSATDKADTLLQILMNDTARNELIVADIKREVKAGRKVLVLTERKAHIEILYQYLKGKYDLIILTGEDKEDKKKAKLNQVEAGDFQLLLATGQYIGEGADINSLNCLILAYPFSFEGKLVQYIGRVQRSTITPVIYDYNDHRIAYLSDLFKGRNRYYRKLIKAGRLSKFDELILVFKGQEFYINESEDWISINCLDLPLPVDQFKEDIAWKIRVINYDEEEGHLLSEILDYDFPLSQSISPLQGSFYFYGIEKIRFRNIDTNGLLNSVILSQNKPVVAARSGNEETVYPEQVLIKVMKVPLWKIGFLPGAVSFPIFIEELGRELSFEIVNPDIRPEFEAIRDYFAKALKKKLFTVDIAIRYNAEKILSCTATSADIQSINTSMIDTVRFEFVKKGLLGPRAITDQQMHTAEHLLTPYKNAKKIFTSDQELINDILNVKKSKHYLQLKYLSAKHEASVLKVRFVLQPFSFVFLLAGEKSFHIVLETLDTDEATYIWHSVKTRESLKANLIKIEVDLTFIRNNGRQKFLEQNPQNFSRIVHDYSDSKKGFMDWKGIIEERIV